ncbi:helix-turn-helix domain-containing protein [Streptomyces sp. CA-250714]|uniref:helix-turn-helix domain-containing protein n=1 Tax=Streptomyces sp. CA-250714 TaxID=3240060 RepID=UPI003D91F151
MGRKQNGGDDLRGSPVARRLGEDIKQVRLARKLTQKQLGHGTGYSEGYVSRVEAGIRLPSERFAAGCDKVFGTGSLFAEQLRRLLHGDRIPEWFAPYIDLEERADRILDFSPIFPMGMLQTPEYAEAVYRAGAMAARGEDFGPALAARITRRKLLEKKDAPLLWVVFTESCLRTPVGPASVMRGQLEHLADVSEHPRVTIQVLPYKAGASPCPSPYTMLRADTKWSVYTEFPYGGRAYDDEQFAAACMDMYDLLRARALSPEESVRYIREISEVYQ